MSHFVGKADVQDTDACLSSGHCSWSKCSVEGLVEEGKGEKVKEEQEEQEEEEEQDEEQDDESSSEEAWWRTASLNREDVKLKRNVVGDGSGS